MTIEKLSPDEINGLLAQEGTEEKLTSNSSLSKVEKEALTELLSVSLGSSSTVLTTLLSEQVTVMTPMLTIKPKEKLLTSTQPFHVVLGEYTGEVNGIQILFISKADAQTITQMVDESNEAEDIEQQFEVMQVVVQQMFDSVSQSLSTILDQEFTHSLSAMDVIENQEGFQVSKFTQEKWFVEASFELKIGRQKSVSFYLCIPVQLAKQMVGILTDTMDEEYPGETQEMQFQDIKQSDDINTTKVEDSDSTQTIQTVQFSSFDETAATTYAEPNNLNMLLDIPLQVTVELGRTKRMVKEILEVSKGSIIELDKLAGEPVDILINNKLIAVGEVVVIDENFGVRVTDILSTADRISKLR
ncbi:flagellar motor switch phosphatase FliY [Paenisporosarcina indica]|uniref:flagellar motor switch phosphatase FliY n=1 Tax=Paenisporosarcina indica TaxID=650093 RepID=UPI00094FDBC6|nr:flagellar motor switch phosphatase FliY [Paenisporosarcina indica]